MEFVKKLKGFLLKPSMTFDASIEDNLSDAIKYYIRIAVIYSIFSSLYNYFIGNYFSLISQRLPMIWGGLLNCLTLEPQGGGDFTSRPVMFSGTLLGVGTKIYYFISLLSLQVIDAYFNHFNIYFENRNIGIIGVIITPALFFLSIFSSIIEIMTNNITVPLTLLIFSIMGIFISSSIVHIGVLIVGGKKGMKMTMKALLYGSTPRLLLGWIPFIGIIAEIWSIFLEIIGMRKLQEITTGKAIIALMSIIVIAIYIASGLAAWYAYT